MRKFYKFSLALILCMLGAMKMSAQEIAPLNADLFFQWDGWGADAHKVGPAECLYVVNESTGQPYGDPSVINYADLSLYAKLVVTVTEGTPRFLFNRTMDGGQYNANEENSNLLEYPKNGWTDRFFTVEGSDYIVDLKKMVKEKGFAHLHAIKGAYWGNVTVTSMELYSEGKNVTVVLPDGTDAHAYTHMWLELTNIESGEHMHYVMTNSKTYTFHNILKNTVWNVVLRNERGDVFGQIDNVEVKDEDVTVTFTELSKPQNVTLSVITPDGQNVTKDTQVTWTDVSGNYLAQGATLTGLPVGCQVHYSVGLSQELAMAYNTPLAVDYSLKDGDNAITCQLEAIKQTQITGKIFDAATRHPLSGAIVSASQTFGGRYDKTLNAKTDRNGVFSLDVACVPTSLFFATPDYVSKTINFDSLMNGETSVVLPDILLEPITGAVITVDFTYTECSIGEGEADTQNWYGDYQNVNFEMFNVTKNHTISQFNVQYPQIVLLEDVEDGDVLRLTATSRTNAFMPVTCLVTVAEQKTAASFSITELGRIQASITKTGNASFVGSLYDTTGKLVNIYNYIYKDSNASLTINNLADGSYTLVSMGSSQFYNTIYDLAQLPQTGLEAGKDYVQNLVEVRSGVISKVVIPEVPTLDESKLYYTGENTSFTVNKSSIVVGNYLTLTGSIDFKPTYATSVSNVQMIVDLPESCQFVENSVMVGNSTSSYMLNGYQITIPIARYTDRVRFCIIPTLGGEHVPSAFVQFDLNGETITQPIGSAYYSAKDLSISVPSTVANTAIPVSGTAIGQSQVEIYDTGTLIGQTTSLANGNWATTCELNNPYNLSMHTIYAKVKNKSGMELTSESQEVKYDINNVVPEKVTMLYYNPEYVGQYNIVFDLINKTVTPNSYYFFPYKSWPNWYGSGTEPKDFTFIADLSNNDSTAVNGVTIRVYTNNGNWRNIEAQYNTSMNKWVAVSQFVEEEAPVGVEVELTSTNEAVLDTKEISDIKKQNDEVIDIYTAEKDSTDNLVNIIIENLSDDTDYNYINSLFDNFNISLSEGHESERLGAMDSNSLCQYVDSLCESLSNEIVGVELDADSILSTYGKIFEYNVNIDGLNAFISYSKPEITDIEKLLEMGYIKIPTTYGDIFERWSNNIYTRINIEEDVCMTIVITHSQRNTLSKRKEKAWDNIKSMCWELRATLANLVSGLKYTQKQLRTFESWFTLECDRNYAKLMKDDQAIADAIKAIDNEIAKTPGFKQLSLISRKNVLLAQRAIISGKLAEIVASQKATLKFVGSAIGNLTSIISLLIEEMQTFDKVNSLDVPKCLYSCDLSAARELEDDIEDLWQFIYEWYCWSAARCGLYVLGDVVLSESVVLPIVLTIVEGAGEKTYHNRKLQEFRGRYSYLNSKITRYKQKCKDNDKCPRCGKKPCECKDKCPKCGNKPCTCNKKCPKCGKNPCECKPPYPQIPPIHDPSGYVYEGVISNRLQGVTATAYYKEDVEDMYGDLHENIVKWDAEEYGQQNPLFTDEYGMYRWDVPQGLWQVKFEKEGYETTYSEWLPVPPPQLDINIPMRQYVQPNVKMAHAYEDAVEVEFDKYMMPEFLTAENIMVIQSGQPVEGSIELLNIESSSEGSEEKFASKVRFNASQPFTEQEVTLMVSNRVKSYMGINMQDDFSQTFAAEYEIKNIVCDSLVELYYGENSTLTVSVLPALASRGKVLDVKSSSSLILGVDTEQVTIGDDGKAEITVSGELPGTAALTFSVEGTDKTAITIVNIEQFMFKTVTTPTASIASGTTVAKGMEVYLYCETEGATIYYTLDGSCPCDDTESRKVYDGTPIIINSSVTIKAMAVAPNMTESDVAEFKYIVDDANNIDELSIKGIVQIYPLPVRDKLNVSAGGKEIKNVMISSKDGIMVVSSTTNAKNVTLDVSTIQAGVYIIHVALEDGTYSRKILKVQ